MMARYYSPSITLSTNYRWKQVVVQFKLGSCAAMSFLLSNDIMFFLVCFHILKTLFGRQVAIDASMSIYQFFIAVRQKDGKILTYNTGETTSYLMGIFLLSE